MSFCRASFFCFCRFICNILGAKTCTFVQLYRNLYVWDLVTPLISIGVLRLVLALLLLSMDVNLVLFLSSSST